MSIKGCGLILIVFCCCAISAAAQNAMPDSLLYSPSAAAAIDQFNHQTHMQSEIYNGAYYELYPPANRGTFYFQDKNYGEASVIRYNGTWYKSVPVLYDVYHDAMVATSDSGLYIMNDRNLSDIYLLDHHFIHLNADVAPGVLTPGYYDELYGGASSVLVKRIKFVDESVTTQTVYEDRSDVYVKKQGKYYQVNTKGAFLDLFKDKKKQLNQYLDDNKIKYNKDKEGAAAKLASYYDQISR